MAVGAFALILQAQFSLILDVRLLVFAFLVLLRRLQHRHRELPLEACTVEGALHDVDVGIVDGDAPSARLRLHVLEDDLGIAAHACSVDEQVVQAADDAAFVLLVLCLDDLRELHLHVVNPQTAPVVGIRESGLAVYALVELVFLRQ